MDRRPENLEYTCQLLRQAVEGGRVGTWYWYFDTNQLEWSDLCKEFFFLPAGASPSFEHLKSVLHPEDRERIEQVIVSACENRIDRFHDEHRVVGPDGGVRWVAVSGLAQSDAQGHLYAMAGTVIDITQHKAAEVALEESRLQLSLALAGAELGTWDVDIPTGRSIYDERYCAMLGYRVEEIEPTLDGWQRQIHPDDLAIVNEAIRAHLAGETCRYDVEYRLRHKAGHWVWVLARGKVTYDAAGRPLRATGTLLDITDRKRVATEGADLLRKIEALLAGLDRRRNGAQNSHHEDSSAQVRLSPRNRQVLGLVAAGLTSAEIAQRLGISNETAMTHRRNLMRKLGLRNKAELIRYALRRNLGES